MIITKYKLFWRNENVAVQHNMHWFVTRSGKSIKHQISFVRIDILSARPSQRLDCPAMPKVAQRWLQMTCSVNHNNIFYVLCDASKAASVTTEISGTMAIPQSSQEEDSSTGELEIWWFGYT